MNSKILRTVLYDQHLLLNAKIVEYGGFMMPISYPKGINYECHVVRNDVGIFDVSHMGELFVSGSDAVNFLQKVTSNDVNKLNIGQAQYTLMCNSDGGIIDDLILYRKEDGFLMVVNASNIQKDFNWLIKHQTSNVDIVNVSNNISLIAVQGPNSRKVLSKVTNLNLNIPFYSFIEGNICDKFAMISRTGYTGELGFEIYSNNRNIEIIWKELINLDAKPIGLAARDILRLEMSYCLYGNDITENSNPIEAGLNWITSMKKQFIGFKKIKRTLEDGPNKKLVSFIMEEKGIPRKGYKVFYDEKEIGIVTSGTHSPTLNKGIGLAYINYPCYKINNIVNIKIRNKFIKAKIVTTSFIQNTSLQNN